MDILVIEDDPTVRRIITKALEGHGYSVKTADNGLQALSDVQENEFRAIVCDLGLPFLEGKSLFDAIADDHPEKAARIVFVTGQADDPKTRSFLDGTGRPVVAKPFDVADLVRTVGLVAGQPARGG